MEPKKKTLRHSATRPSVINAPISLNVLMPCKKTSMRLGRMRRLQVGDGIT